MKFPSAQRARLAAIYRHARKTGGGEFARSLRRSYRGAVSQLVDETVRELLHGVNRGARL